MTKVKKTFDFQTIIKTGLITGFISSTFGFIYNIGIRELFIQQNYLVYEKPIITNYIEGYKKFTVGNINVNYIGQSFVENISFSVSLNGSNIKCSYEQSSYHIKVLTPLGTKTVVDTLDNNIYTIPYLNGTENVRFQFKIPGYISSDNLKIELRGKGLIGNELLDKVDPLKKVFYPLVCFLLMLIMLLLYAILKKRQNEKKLKMSLLIP